MTLSLDEYRCELINKILFAISQDEVKLFCNTAMNRLEHHKVNGHIVLRFIDRTISELEQFNPIKKDAQQWSNINMARIFFNRIKQQLSETVN